MLFNTEPPPTASVEKYSGLATRSSQHFTEESSLQLIDNEASQYKFAENIHVTTGSV